MIKKALSTILIAASIANTLPSNAFTQIQYVVDKNGAIIADKTGAYVRAEMNKGNLKNIKAKLKRPNDIDIYVNATIPTIEDSVQTTITVGSILEKIQDSIDLWNNIPESKIQINSPILTTLENDSEDGKFLILGTPSEAVSGAPDLTGSYSIINIATSNTATIGGRKINTAPGRILDVDTILNPSKGKCVAYFTTDGTFETGGNAAASTESGGYDTDVADENCLAEDGVSHEVSVNDIGDIATKSIGKILGLEISGIVTAALGRSAQNMIRYSLTKDDIIGAVNIYPNKVNFVDRGTVKGKVKAGQTPIVGAHVVLEDVITGEVVTSAITDFYGNYKIKAVPAGTYIAIAEPLDGPIRPNAFLSTNANDAEKDFTTTVSDIFTVNDNRRKTVNIMVNNTGAPTFNINPRVGSYTTNATVTAIGGNPIYAVCSPGETLTSVRFWGTNIDATIGTLSVSGSDVTVSGVANASIPISGVDGAEEYPGFTANITCQLGAEPGPRNIKFITNLLPPTDPNFLLQDQIVGGLIVRE